MYAYVSHWDKRNAKGTKERDKRKAKGVYYKVGGDERLHPFLFPQIGLLKVCLLWPIIYEGLLI